MRNLRNGKVRFVMGRVMTGDYDDKKANQIQKFSSEWLMRGDVGSIWTFICYRALHYYYKLFKYIYPEVHFCLFFKSALEKRRLALHLDANKLFMYFFLGS